MEILVSLAMKFWMWSIVILVIIVGLIINLFDKKKPQSNNFSYKKMPVMRALPIRTKGKGFFKGILLWILTTRNWEIAEDFEYELNDIKYTIPAGFKFDGASIPKFLHTFLSPVGVLLMGGLIHDYAYKYQTLLEINKADTLGVISQKRADEIFRDINIGVNGFYLMNYLAYYSLRLGGFLAWRKHRKVGAKIK
jgi:uncharacterized membrane protein|tara:strand:+ start:1214 stop:1795 length:582 start_codon:yes stop_codon:yes gene_type:complete